MSFKIAIASGKGGTGKTSVSVNLFYWFKKYYQDRIQLIDCDVEEPNDILFFPDTIISDYHDVLQLIPEIDTTKCTFCQKCVTWCEFNSIVVIPGVKFAQVNPALCHSCGACSVACNDSAISEKAASIGKISRYDFPGNSELLEGKLNIGSPMQTMLIKELKKQASKSYDIVLYDAPPGTSCPVVETIGDANYIILVAEPTLFGLHDLKLMTELISEMNIPFGVIINKSGLGNNDLNNYLMKHNIEILGEIPFSKDYASSYATGNLFEYIPAEIEKTYKDIIERLERKMLIHEGNNYFKW